MDVNNVVATSTNTATAQSYSRSYAGQPVASSAVSVETTRAPDRPAAERPGRQGSPANVAANAPINTGDQAHDIRIENAPRISELGSRIASDEDITDSLLDRAFQDVNRVLDGSSFSLSYSVHEATGRVLVQVHDDQGEVIREIPPESRLDIYARITEFTGLLFDRSN